MMPIVIITLILKRQNFRRKDAKIGENCDRNINVFLWNAGDANGWAPEDMFAINEREYNVTTTFKSNLEGYTHQLKLDRESQEYR
jgi:hypothetical protein